MIACYLAADSKWPYRDTTWGTIVAVCRSFTGRCNEMVSAGHRFRELQWSRGLNWNKRKKFFAWCTRALYRSLIVVSSSTYCWIKTALAEQAWRVEVIVSDIERGSWCLQWGSINYVEPSGVVFLNFIRGSVGRQLAALFMIVSVCVGVPRRVGFAAISLTQWLGASMCVWRQIAGDWPARCSLAR